MSNPSSSFGSQHTSKVDKAALARRLQRFETQFEEIQKKLIINGISPIYSHDDGTTRLVDWSNFPHSVTLNGASLPPERVDRKTIQVENMISHVRRMINCGKERGIERMRIVDFCGGTASLSLALAFIFPQHEFVCLDCKEASLLIAIDRAKKSKLQNVRIIDTRIEDYAESFHIGVALHACGHLSDMVLEMCIEQKAFFAIAPCCIGKISSVRQMPMSVPFQELMDTNDFHCLIKAADFGHSDLNCYSEKDKRRRICKSFIEWDRLMYAKEKGYSSVHLLVMSPRYASVKNDILVGMPSISSHLVDPLPALPDSMYDAVNESLESFLFCRDCSSKPE